MLLNKLGHKSKSNFAFGTEKKRLIIIDSSVPKKTNYNSQLAPCAIFIDPL